MFMPWPWIRSERFTREDKDTNFNGQGWRYENNRWTDTGLIGSDAIYGLTADADNTMYAAGIDTNKAGQMWKLE